MNSQMKSPALIPGSLGAREVSLTACRALATWEDRGGIPCSSPGPG